VVWLVAPESATQSVTGVGGAGTVELKQPVRDCDSHTLNHGVEGDDCCGGGRGEGGNEGPTCCTGVLGRMRAASTSMELRPGTGRGRTTSMVLSPWTG
jgi:hypothetical protein